MVQMPSEVVRLMVSGSLLFEPPGAMTAFSQFPLSEENVFTVVIAASLISIFVNVFIVRATFRWRGRRFPESVTA